MKNEMIQQDLIQLDMEVENVQDFFEKMSAKLVALGYVKQSFLKAIQSREEQYPTALPTQPYAVAIPHAEPEHIKKQFIAATRLKKTIKWCEMATSDVWHDVKFVFMLGFKNEEGHVELLQVLVENFQEGEFMEKLLVAKTPEAYKEVILTMKGI